jgi:hypothetical protein
MAAAADYVKYLTTTIPEPPGRPNFTHPPPPPPPELGEPAV